MRAISDAQRDAFRAFLVAMGVPAPTAGQAADAAARAVEQGGLESIPSVARRHRCSVRHVWRKVRAAGLPYVSRRGRGGSLVDGAAVDAILGDRHV